jgi:superfamily II DNA or RNA helicase
MKIVVNNNRCKLYGNIKLILRLRDHPLFCLRVKGAFFSPLFRSGRWDGKIRFITETGTFETGKLPQVIDVIRKLSEELGLNTTIELVDEREPLRVYRVPKHLEDYIARPYQLEAVLSIVNNKVEGIPFHRGLINAATNAGKTLITALIHSTFKSKTLLLLNSKELFNDAVKEIPKMIPGEVGILASGHEVEWNNFMICMVQTAAKRIKEVKNKLASYPVVIVDEADLSNSKTYKTVINNTYNSTVRVGLTGSAMVDPRKKEQNERLRAIYGDIIYEIKNRELIDKGFSAEVKVYIHKGETEIEEPDFESEYRLGVIESKVRNNKIKSIARLEATKKNLPLLILVKNHKHVITLYKKFQKESQRKGSSLYKLKIDWVHHKKRSRDRTVQLFKDGITHVLVGSYILRRGKNFPLMRSIIHAGAGDSMANVLQVLGRATRTSKTKTHTNLHDFYDEGAYLRSHSKHRIATYKKEKLKVKELYK